MEEHPLEPELPQFGVEVGVAVLRIAGHRMIGVRGMHADLMRAAGVDRDLDQ